MAKEKLLENVTPEGKNRWYFYLTLAVILAGLIIATVIWLGFITEEDFDRWVVLVGVTVPALLGILGNLRALLHPEKRHTPTDQDPELGPRDHIM